MLLTRCPACRQRLRSSARICEKCGVLTGVTRRSSHDPPIHDWVGVGVIILIAGIYLIALHAVVYEEARPRQLLPALTAE